jgi:hypothetical protein
MPARDRATKGELSKAIRFVAAMETEIAKSQPPTGGKHSAVALYPPEIAASLYALGILKKGELGEVCIDLKPLADQDTLQKLKHLPAQMKYFVENRGAILADYSRLRKAESTIASFMQKIQAEPKLVPHVVAVGWWKMLSMSEMPASIEDFLNEGFSPKDWAVNSMRSIPSLSFGVSERLGNTGSFDRSIGLLRDADLVSSFRYPYDIEESVFKKVRRVLGWEKIERCIPNELIEFLGISWFQVVLLEHKRLIPLEQSLAVRLMSIAMESTGTLLGKSLHDCEDLLERFLLDMENSDVEGVSNLIFLPEVI